MKYICVDPVEYLYPDINVYKSGTEKIEILAVRGSYACAQIMFFGGEGNVKIDCEGWNPEIYEMIAIPVEPNPQEPIKEEMRKAHMPERIAPFLVYDCLKPYDSEIVFKEGVCAVYFSLWIPGDAAVGVINGKIRAGEVNIPVTIEVSSAVVPDETLAVLLCYNQDKVCKYHGVEKNSPAFDRLDTEYLCMLRRMRQNMLYCPKARTISLGENRYEFDFSPMEVFMGKALSLGFTHFFSSLGRRESWKTSTILVGGLPSMSFEGYCYLVQYLTAFTVFLEEHGWTDHFLLSVSDEPNKANCIEYRALCGLVKKYAPKIRLIEAASYRQIYGALDIYIPSSEEYDQNREEYEALRGYGGEIWYYDCCLPRRDGYINRFMDYPLLSTRYHGWANYAYDLRGYLHWAANNYQPEQDPFKQSCPVHRNADSVSILPSGDTHIMYPGESGPWMSVRLENQRAGTEEYEMLRSLAAVDRMKADSICASVFHSFKDVIYDPLVFRDARNALIHAVEEFGGR